MTTSEKEQVFVGIGRDRTSTFIVPVLYKSGQKIGQHKELIHFEPNMPRVLSDEQMQACADEIGNALVLFRIIEGHLKFDPKMTKATAIEIAQKRLAQRNEIIEQNKKLTSGRKKKPVPELTNPQKRLLKHIADKETAKTAKANELSSIKESVLESHALANQVLDEAIAYATQCGEDRDNAIEALTNAQTKLSEKPDDADLKQAVILAGQEVESKTILADDADSKVALAQTAFDKADEAVELLKSATVES